MTDTATADAEASSAELIDAIVAEYWSLPARGRGDFVVERVNGYHSSLTPDFSQGKRAQMTIEFGRRLVGALDVDSGGPMVKLARQIVAGASRHPAAARAQIYNFATEQIAWQIIDERPGLPEHVRAGLHRNFELALAIRGSASAGRA